MQINKTTHSSFFLFAASFSSRSCTRETRKTSSACTRPLLEPLGCLSPPLSLTHTRACNLQFRTGRSVGPAHRAKQVQSRSQEYHASASALYISYTHSPRSMHMHTLLIHAHTLLTHHRDIAHQEFGRLNDFIVHHPALGTGAAVLLNTCASRHKAGAGESQWGSPLWRVLLGEEDTPWVQRQGETPSDCPVTREGHHSDGGVGGGDANLPVFTIAVELSCIGKEARSDAPLHCLLVVTTRLHAHTGTRKEPFELLADAAGMRQATVVEEVLPTPLGAPAVLSSRVHTP